MILHLKWNAKSGFLVESDFHANKIVVCVVLVAEKGAQMDRLVLAHCP